MNVVFGTHMVMKSSLKYVMLNTTFQHTLLDNDYDIRQRLFWFYTQMSPFVANIVTLHIQYVGIKEKQENIV